MTLKKCTDCGTQISENAISCPQCGSPQPKKTNVLTWICVGILGLAFAIWAMSDKSPSAPVESSPEMKSLQAKASTKRAITDALKDPDSAKFEFINDKCGTVNSKNSFGGYVGSRRFVSVDNMVDLEGYNASKSEMDKLWDKFCK